MNVFWNIWNITLGYARDISVPWFMMSTVSTTAFSYLFNITHSYITYAFSIFVLSLYSMHLKRG